MNIKEARGKLGITQRELSDRLGIPKRTIEHWESGDRKPADWAERLIVEKIEEMIKEEEEMKVYNGYLGYEANLKELEKENGVVTYDDRKLYLLQQAYLNNYKDGIAYFASAIDSKGALYNVRWDTTEDWDRAQEKAELEGILEQDGELDPEDDERLDELMEMDLPNPTEEGDACEWNSPAEVTLIDGNEE